MDLQSVPDRDQLLDQLRSANQHTWLWMATRTALIIFLITRIRWAEVVFAPIVSVTACLVIVGPFAMSLLRVWGSKKKRLEDIKETSRFGEFDKYSLQTLFQETLKRLRIPDRRLPVYVTNDKTLNAGALRVGALFGRINGIYLNRQLLHKLNAAELQSVMGHELGHYYRFNLAGDRFRLLTLLLGAIIGVFAVQQIRLDGFLGFLVLSAISYGFWFISGMAMMRHGRAIEHLCDDLGSQVRGVAASINALLKVGIDAETRFLIELEVLARCADNPLLTPREVLDSIEQATPYGSTSETEMYDSIRRKLKDRSQRNQKASLSGFLKYVWESDGEDEEDFQQQLEAQAKLVNRIDRLEWESALGIDENVELNETQVRSLVDLILNSPEKSLFRIPGSYGDSDGIHPPTKDRILYLWKNRENQTELTIT